MLTAHRNVNLATTVSVKSIKHLHVTRHRRGLCVVSAAAPLTKQKEDTRIRKLPFIDCNRQRVFLSRGDCLELLSRVADYCQSHASTSTSVHSSGPTDASYPEQESQDASEEYGLMSQVFDALYDELEEVFFSKRGYLIPRREAALVEATGGSPTYGEITGEGVVQFLQRIPLQPDDVLVDLGSGLGRLTLQVAASARIRRCEGIELSASRHEQACWVTQRLVEINSEEEQEEEEAAELPPPPPGVATAAAGSAAASGSTALLSTTITTTSVRSHDSEAEADAGSQRGHRFGSGPGLLLSPVELRCEDLMTADLRDGTAFFLCSTAFSGGACRAIADRLAGHPPFRMLVTSRALPFPSPLTLLGQFPCSFTWTAAGTAYVYVRSLQEAPAGLLAAFLSAPAPGPAATRPAAASTAAEAGGGHEVEAGGDRSGSSGGSGGIAWLPSLSTLSVVPCDLMV